MKGGTELLAQAIAMDPLSASKLTLREIREIASGMLEAQRQWLPQFGGESVRLRPKIEIPENVEPVEVLLDPALAFTSRFGKLAEA